ncbi:hypothetical protein [Rugamonas sp.]|uniref:hypothetical protein n=1 Tax=Rugamonas sp. TaxID=1926287 RepID=UPI0025DA87E6|nr:hypothetical protein [Rugamonas sp.]
MSTTNHLGNLGEDVVSLLFRRRIDKVYRFSVTFLGEKAQLLDFMVNLLDDNGSEYGPFFFLQVKTTATIGAPGAGIPATFTAEEVRNARARKVPVYLVAVESGDDDAERIFAIAIDETLKGGVAVVPPIFSLADKATRMRIYDEVHAYFLSEAKIFQSHLTRQAYASQKGREGNDEQS